jgi:hypothetical protein
LFFAVACDLARAADGKVIVGQETRIACDQAILLCKGSCSDYRKIIVTAGKASHYDGVVMSSVMKDYIQTRYPEAQVVALEGSPFNTDGEVKALAAYVQATTPHAEIYVCNKWWHMFRTLMLIGIRFPEAELGTDGVSPAYCHSNAGLRPMVTEIPKALVTLAWFLFKNTQLGAFTFWGNTRNA